MNAKNQIGALPLALSFAAVYVAVAATAGYLTLDTQPPEPTAAAAATTPALPVITTTTTTAAESTTSTTPVTTTTTTANLPPDLKRVEAPNGLVTAIPVQWPVTTGTVDTTLVAADPTSPRREVRLGGAPVTDSSKPLLDRITEAAAQREREPGHRRVTLSATTIRSHPAVSWEFDESATSGPKRVATAFWESNGVEYVLYSAGPPEEWETTRARLARMIELAGP
ncbi:hypothetical protein [Saccharothrix deserti]|uniref:hypothetical protein n=1 Tax=Saccharothrix deserti TaxID=2593674 RepID=UPI00131C93F4|nr:hypothetical protein [Saccharothrix deserti]